jgi:hypothetical protein
MGWWGRRRRRWECIKLFAAQHAVAIGIELIKQLVVRLWWRRLVPLIAIIATLALLSLLTLLALRRWRWTMIPVPLMLS